MVVPVQLWWGDQFKICISYMLCFDWDAQGTCLIYIAGLSQTQVVYMFNCGWVVILRFVFLYVVL